MNLLTYTPRRARRTFPERHDVLIFEDRSSTGLITMQTSDYTPLLAVFKITFASYKQWENGSHDDRTIKVFFPWTRAAWNAAWRIARLISEANPFRPALLDRSVLRHVTRIDVPFFMSNFVEEVES